MADVNDRSFWDDVLGRESLAWGAAASPVIEWLGAQRPPPARVLVPGCGYGRNALGLAELGYDVVATDTANAGLERARASFADRAIEYVEEDVFDLADEFFDAILAHYVIHLFDADARARLLSIWWSALRPGGLLVLTALSTNCSFFGQGREIEPGLWSNPEWIPIHFETPATLAAQLTECGFIGVHAEERDEPENRPTGSITTPTIYASGRR